MPDQPGFLFLRMIWDRRETPMPPVRIARMMSLHYGPEPDHPFGRRGRAMEAAWKQLSGPATAGMLLLDGDVVIDPWDYTVMAAHIQAEPAAVHVAPVKLWQVSKTDMELAWAWGHCRNGVFTQDDYGPEDPDFFCFNFTYLPRALVEACIKAGLRSWMFPTVDKEVSRVFRRSGIPVRVVKDCTPKHMHY